uniref:Uncharacterized protein n=1 Tax=Bactrocera latifrons TaxID=174628 RepID=A0A0K8TWU3_BACLA
MKNINIDYNDDYTGGAEEEYYGGFDAATASSRSKNDKNWENWERIREQKLERMKNICFESYRRSKRDRMQQAKPKPKQLDPTWYTDNIYSNRSEDLEEDYVPDCLKYGAYRKLRNIREQDEFFVEDILDDAPQDVGSKGKRGEGEGSSSYGLHRSISCKEFQYPKSQSCYVMSGGTSYEGGTTSILKKTNVPKSYSFSATTSKTTPFDVMDYELPQTGATRRDKQEAFRKSAGYYCSSSLDESTLAYATHEPPTSTPPPPPAPHSCCAREQCTSANCLLDEIYPSYTAAAGRRTWRSRGTPVGMCGAGAGGGSNRNLHTASASTTTDWVEERERGSQRVAAASRCSIHSGRGRDHERDRHSDRECEQPPPPPPTVWQRPRATQYTRDVGAIMNVTATAIVSVSSHRRRHQRLYAVVPPMTIATTASNSAILPGRVRAYTVPATTRQPKRRNTYTAAPWPTTPISIISFVMNENVC